MWSFVIHYIFWQLCILVPFFTCTKVARLLRRIPMYLSPRFSSNFCFLFRLLSMFTHLCSQSYICTCMYVCMYHKSVQSEIPLFSVVVFCNSGRSSELVNTEYLLLEGIQDYIPLNLWSQPFLIKWATHNFVLCVYCLKRAYLIYK